VERASEAPPPGPVLLIANHVNLYDVPLILYALPGVLRGRLAVAMSAEVLGDLRYGRGQGSGPLKLLGQAAYWLLTALFNVFPLPRLRGFRRSFAHAGEALDRGESVLIFPEGRRGYTGQLQPFRPGVGLLAEAARVPVLPVALSGMGTAARGGRRWWHSGEITVGVGAPLRFGPGTPPEEITRQLEAALRTLGPGQELIS
jgi:long-chain acyl-CoA synthetase